MLSRIANYLLGSSEAQGEQDSENNGFSSQIPVEMPRLRQINVEGDDWILIDRHSMDESWYVTPPACFTQASPVHVETSPLENLLIEHPSMSVYRSAGQAPSQKPTLKHNKLKNNNKQPQRPPLAQRRQDNESNKREKQHEILQAVNPSRRPSSLRDSRTQRNDENLRIVQVRSAQKIMEKRNSTCSKRNLLERGNKVREVSSGKSKRPRRQDRLRLNNSGANNNRKC